MEEEKSRITTVQFFILMFVTRIIVMIILNPQQVGGEYLLDNILSFFVSAAVGFIIVLPVLALNKKYPTLDIPGVAQMNFGWAGRIVPAVYALYTLAVNAISFSIFNTFVSESMQPEIPSWLIIITIVLCGLYGALKGLEAMARCAVCVFAALIIGSVAMFAALLSNFERANLEPLFYGGFSQFEMGILRFVGRTTSFADIALLLPQVKGKKLKGIAWWSVGTSVFFSVTVLFTVGCLGRFAYLQSFPVYTLASLTKVGVIPRFDAVFIGVWIMGLAIKSAVDIFVCSRCLCETFGKNQSVAGKWFKAGSCAAILGLTALIISREELKAVLQKPVFMFSLTLAVGLALPLIIYAVDLIRTRRAKRRGGT